MPTVDSAQLELEDIVNTVEEIKISIKDYNEERNFYKLRRQACAHFGVEIPFKTEVFNEEQLIKYIQENADPNYWRAEEKNDLDSIGYTHIIV